MAGTKGPKNGTVNLKAVGVSEDGTSLTLARRANAKGGFRLAIDSSLVEQLEVARTRVLARAARERVAEPPAEPTTPRRVEPRPTSALTIKEIQALLRRGRSAAAVAKKAGVSPEWVERFEPPIIWERAGMAERARRATFYRPRMGPSGSSLGPSVEVNLKKRGVTMDADRMAEAWDSVKRPRGDKWVVGFRFTNRGSKLAEWEFDPDSGKLRALNNLAAEIGWVPARGKRKRSAS